MLSEDQLGGFEGPLASVAAGRNRGRAATGILREESWKSDSTFNGISHSFGFGCDRILDLLLESVDDVFVSQSNRKII